jgi:hypothetical protein
VTSETRVAPSETVEVRLPAFGDDAGPYAKRTFQSEFERDSYADCPWVPAKSSGIETFGRRLRGLLAVVHSAMCSCVNPVGSHNCRCVAVFVVRYGTRQPKSPSR